MVDSAIHKRLILTLATGFGAGYSAKAPGTVGTFVAIIPLLLLQQLPLWIYAVILIASCLLGVYLCARADSYLGSHDNKMIVWDEFCGYWITMFAAPEGLVPLLIGFILFRLFDILKPWPVSWADKKVQGGLGVMLDDIFAGGVAWFFLQLIYIIY